MGSALKEQSQPKKQERLEARIADEPKRLIQRAAELRGMSVSDFVVESSRRAAIETIRESEVLSLNERASKVFVDAVLNPAVPNEKARAAAKRHRREVRG